MTVAFFGIIITLFIVWAVFRMLEKEGRNKFGHLDYFALFNTGVIWLLFGIIMGNDFFIIAGMGLVIAGLFNRDKWKKEEREWKKENKDAGFLKAFIIGLVAAAILSAGIFLLIIG